VICDGREKPLSIVRWGIGENRATLFRQHFFVSGAAPALTTPTRPVHTSFPVWACGLAASNLKSRLLRGRAPVLEFTDIIPYLIAALTFISIVYALRRYFSLRDAANSADFQEFRQEADTLGKSRDS